MIPKVTRDEQLTGILACGHILPTLVKKTYPTHKTVPSLPCSCGIHQCMHPNHHHQRKDALGSACHAGSGSGFAIPHHPLGLRFAHIVHATCCSTADLLENRSSQKLWNGRHTGVGRSSESRFEIVKQHSADDSRSSSLSTT